MKRLGNLYPRLCMPGTIDQAITDTTRGKRRSRDVAWLLFRRDEVIARLVEELSRGTWQPGTIELLSVRDPKPRIIARAPIEDRVIHTAMVGLMGPAITRTLTDDCFACLPGRGTHRAVLRLLEHQRRHRFCVHLDVRAYFPSIDHAVLRGLLHRRLKCAPFLDLLDEIIVSGSRIYARPGVRAWAKLPPGVATPGKGLAIGAHTSQVLAAHLYLDGLDHFVKRQLKVPGYLRYVDDLFLFGDRRADLRRWRAEVGDRLAGERLLKLKPPHARVLSCRGHLDALGYRIRRDEIRPLGRAVRRMQGRMRAELEGRGTVAAERSLASTVGIAMFSTEVVGRADREP